MDKESAYDLSRTRLFYFVLAAIFGIFISLSGYILLHLTAHESAINIIQTWYSLHMKSYEEYKILLNEMIKSQYSDAYEIKKLHEQVNEYRDAMKELEKTLKFQGVQLDYLIDWERQVTFKTSPMEKYPR